MSFHVLYSQIMMISHVLINFNSPILSDSWISTMGKFCLESETYFKCFCGYSIDMIICQIARVAFHTYVCLKRTIKGKTTWSTNVKIYWNSHIYHSVNRILWLLEVVNTLSASPGNVIKCYHPQAENFYKTNFWGICS